MRLGSSSPGSANSNEPAAGAMGAPAWKEVGDGAIELSHLAQPLPRPAPVSPPTPLALKLGAGALAAAGHRVAVATVEHRQ